MAFAIINIVLVLIAIILIVLRLVFMIYSYKRTNGVIVFDEESGIAHLELNPKTELKDGAHLVVEVMSIRELHKS